MSAPEDLIPGIKSRVAAELDRIHDAEQLARARGDDAEADRYVAQMEDILTALTRIADAEEERVRQGKQKIRIDVHRRSDDFIDHLYAYPVD